jgi:hypothetical protein
MRVKPIKDFSAKRLDQMALDRSDVRPMSAASRRKWEAAKRTGKRMHRLLLKRVLDWPAKSRSVILPGMSAVQLRREIKKAVDKLPPGRLESLADYVQFLTRPDLDTRLKAAEKAIASGKGVNWRKVRDDV